MINGKKRSFDEVAATWDEKPARVKLARDVGDAIAQRIEFAPEMDVMDFGCGTGLISLRFQPLVRSITGVDSSPGMLEVFRQKAAQARWDNVRGVLADLEQGEPLTGSYDVVLSSMTLHHIQDLKALLEQFYSIIKFGGSLCIADLDQEEGRFHDDNTGIYHFGFEREQLRELFREAGFVDVREADAAEMVKEGGDGEVRRFTIFLMAGRKCVSQC